ncbi:MAG: terminus macrodomain insulation protein YfbV [Lonepinella koalarum]|nr:terminus macrodomain insulation protein YfbV [Lonepinella koalarum]
MIHLFKKGQDYADTWVLHPKLGAIFPENRIIKSTKFAQKYMPFVAVFAIVWQQFSSKGNEIAFAAAVLTAVFALAIPLQGLYWLGKRSTQVLPTQSAVKFHQIAEQLEKHNIIISKVEKPTYFDLALLLKKAEQFLSPDFWEEL